MLQRPSASCTGSPAASRLRTASSERAGQHCSTPPAKPTSTLSPPAAHRPPPAVCAQWRSFHGNSYPLFIRADVEALARRVREEKEAQERERLGPEEYERRKALAAAKNVGGGRRRGGSGEETRAARRRTGSAANCQSRLAPCCCCTRAAGPWFQAVARPRNAAAWSGGPQTGARPAARRAQPKPQPAAARRSTPLCWRTRRP